MASNEKRRLDIIAQVTDLVSGPMRKIGRSFRKGFGVGKTAVSGFRKALQGTQALLGVIAAGAVAQKSIAAFSAVSEGLRDVNNQAAATNTSASSLVTLRNAGEQVGVKFEAMAAAVRTFEKNIGDARQGAKTQNETLRRLGLTTEQFVGTGKDATEQMAVVADALGTVEDSTVRTNLALKLFGEDTGAALLPILNEGGDALRSFAKDQAAVGATFTDSEIAGVAEVQRQMALLNVTVRQLVERFVVDAAPAFSQFFTNLRELITANGPFILEVLKELAVSFSALFGGLIKVGGLLRKSFLGLQQIAAAVELALANLSGDSEGIAVVTRRLQDLILKVEQNDAATDALAKTFFDLDKIWQQMGERKFPEPPDPTGQAAAVAKLDGAWGRFYKGFVENTRRARDRFSDFYTEGLNAANKLVDQGLNRMGDAIGDAITRVKTAKEAFRELATSVLRDLGRIIGRLVTVNLVSSLFGGTGGGTATAETGAVFGGEVSKTMPLRRFEKGGVVRRPTLALFGEGKASKGEAFVPLPDGRRIPVALQGAGGGGNVLNFNISAMDGQDVARVLFNNRGTLRALHQRDLVGQQNVRQSTRSAVG